MGKLNLVDLAGSERQAKAQTQGERFNRISGKHRTPLAPGLDISCKCRQGRGCAWAS